MTREEAIDILDDNFTVINTHGHYTDEEVEQTRQMAIKALEQLKWVPVNERLPELGQPVLTFDGSCICVERRIKWIDTPEGQLDGEWWIDGYDGDEYNPIGLRDGTAIAWMPLPESYKAESEDKS